MNECLSHPMSDFKLDILGKIVRWREVYKNLKIRRASKISVTLQTSTLMPVAADEASLMAPMRGSSVGWIKSQIHSIQVLNNSLVIIKPVTARIKMKSTQSRSQKQTVSPMMPSVSWMTTLRSRLIAWYIPEKKMLTFLSGREFL
jgi:hypothetical protein